MSVVRLRPLAEDDLVERTRDYRIEGVIDLGVRCFDAAIAALQAIEQMPHAGSPRAGEVADVPGLRVRRVPGFPVGWFYSNARTTPTSCACSPTPKTRPSASPTSTPA